VDLPVFPLKMTASPAEIYRRRERKVRCGKHFAILIFCPRWMDLWNRPSTPKEIIEA
jgi:hypothetical protein